TVALSADERRPGDLLHRSGGQIRRQGPGRFAEYQRRVPGGIPLVGPRTSPAAASACKSEGMRGCVQNSIQRIGSMFSTWRRRILFAFLIVVVGLSVPVVMELYARSKARSDLEKIIAELDRTDPRWRLEDIEADRQQVPEEKNSANTVI